MKPVRIATRGSDLALWQARYIAERIEGALGRACEIVPLKTIGDRLLGSLAKVGGKGLFVKEIEEALLDGRADVAVHSAKDLPAEVDPALDLVAFPERADPRDALIVRDGAAGLAGLRRGARVGTGSVRRTAQLRRARADLEIVPLRGNVPTRLAKLESESLDAVVLACAGLERLGLADRITERIAADLLLPAVAQGALAVQARRDDPLGAQLAALDHRESALRVTAERAFLTRLGGDCNVPLAAFAEVDASDRLRLRGLVISPAGDRVAQSERELVIADTERSRAVAVAEGAGREVAAEVLARGGAELLAAARAEDAP